MSKEKKKMALWKKFLIVFFVMGVLGAFIGERDGTTSSQVSASTKPPVTIPPDQQSFVDSIRPYILEYKSASNELKKTAVRGKRSDSVRSTLTGKLVVNDWVGKIEEMTTTTVGNAHLSLLFPGSPQIRVQTWNNEISDIMTNSLIPNKSSVYNQVAELSIGDMVTFSGSFVGDDIHVISEQSMTERGSMLTPEFTFIFSSVSKMRP